MDLLLLADDACLYIQSGQHVIPERCTLALLDLLPSVVCVSPQQALQIKTDKEGKSSPT